MEVPSARLASRRAFLCIYVSPQGVRPPTAVAVEKRTMEAADVLYGVTMQPGGSSKVVSEKVTTVA